MDNGAIEVLQYFFHDMYAWEDSAYKKLQESKNTLNPVEYDIFFRQLLSEGQNVYTKYLTQKDRKLGNVVSIGIPYRYNPNIEIITHSIEKNKSTYHIETQVGGIFPHRALYIMKYEENEWRIDSKKKSLLGSEVWKTTLI